jgi:hypothetical protein
LGVREREVDPLEQVERIEYYDCMPTSGVQHAQAGAGASGQTLHDDTKGVGLS